MSKRKIDYLFQRAGSSNWQLRLQTFDADGKRRSVEKSLGTSDRAEAQRIAWQACPAHRQAVLDRRPRIVTGQRMLEPGWHTADDGRKVFATANEVTFFGDDDSTTTIPNVANAVLNCHPDHHRIIVDRDGIKAQPVQIVGGEQRDVGRAFNLEKP